MIKHIVMWKVKGDSHDERAQNAQKIQSAFQGLAGKIPGLEYIEIGVDFSQVDYAYDVVLYSEFTNYKALRDYADHPEHKRVLEELGEIRTSRCQVDYAVN